MPVHPRWLPMSCSLLAPVPSTLHFPFNELQLRGGEWGSVSTGLDSDLSHTRDTMQISTMLINKASIHLPSYGHTRSLVAKGTARRDNSVWINNAIEWVKPLTMDRMCVCTPASSWRSLSGDKLRLWTKALYCTPFKNHRTKAHSDDWWTSQP